MKMLRYLSSVLLLVAATCEAQSQFPGVLLTPNGLAAPTFLRLQQDPAPQPGLFLQNPRTPATRQGGFQTRVTADKLNDGDTENEKLVASNGGILLERNSIASRTLLRLQQIPSGQPGVLLYQPNQPRAAVPENPEGAEAAPTPKHDDEEEQNVSDSEVEQLKPASGRNNPTQPSGVLIRLQQNKNSQPGVFLYNPVQAAAPTTGNGAGNDNEDEDNVEKTTESNVAPKSRGSAAEDPRSQKLTGTDGENGEYFIYHPSGLLQKVVYSTKDDAANMSFMAKLRYKNVEPISGPIYTYDPETYVFRRI